MLQLPVKIEICIGMIKKPARGFTLIELLVVIAIIGLLSSVVLASLSNARKKSRDARRLEDLRAIQTAMELFASDNNGRYPGGYGTHYWISDNNYNQTVPPLDTCSLGGILPYLSGMTSLCNFKDPQGFVYEYSMNYDGSYRVGAHFETSARQTVPFTWQSGTPPSVVENAVSGWYQNY